MDHEVIDLLSIFGKRRRRWYGSGISVSLIRLEAGTVPRKHLFNWDRLLGVVTVLAVVSLGWAVVGIAVSHFLR
jgi:hypothetical protein